MSSCPSTYLQLELDFSDNTFQNINPEKLTVTLEAVYSGNKVSGSGSRTFGINTFKKNGSTYSREIDMSIFPNYCAQNWNKVGLSNIALGSQSVTTSTFTSGGKSYTSAQAAYEALSNKTFSILFGNINLTDFLMSQGYTAKCSDNSTTVGSNCWLLVNMGDVLGLRIKPNIISMKITNPVPNAPPAIVNNVVFQITDFKHQEKDGTGKLTIGEILIIMALIIIFLIAICLIVYYINKKNNEE